MSLELKNAPMGWNSWDCYGAAVNEEIFRQNAEYMAKNLKQFGWEYMVVDIEWYAPGTTNNEYNPFTDICTDEYSRCIPDPVRFPSSKDGVGFKALADYVHSLGLKFGIHIMRGIPRQAVHQNLAIKGSNKTARQIALTDSICHWNTGMYGVNPENEGAKEYYESIFELYASWGVDFIKCDDICRELPNAEQELIMLSDALKNCGRDMVLSLSPGPALLEKSELYKQTANMWRITDDFWDDWKLLYAMFERAEKWCTHAGHNHYPDADMLPVGAVRQCYSKDEWTKFTEDEQITMLTLWCIMRSPLMIGGEMTKFDDFTLKLLTNEKVLDMFRHSRHAHQVFHNEVYGEEIIGWMAADDRLGSIYVALFNASSNDGSISVPLAEFEIEDSVSAIELWSGKEYTFDSAINVDIPSHGAVVFKINS